jgi:ElaB/YqjD/DUF883 family membrane-anchored ribosome-binding protein
MDQQHDQGTIGGSATQVGNKVSDLAAQTQKAAQDTIEQSKPALRELQARAGEAVGKATDLTRQATNAGVEAVTQASGVARDAANEAYQRSARAGGYVLEFAREQPLTAMLIAGAIGYGIAYLMHRR